MGMLELEKRCPTPGCGRPMVLNHRIGGGGELKDFCWSCTSYYEKGEDGACKTRPVDLRDLCLLHKKSIPELQVKGSELDKYGADPSVKNMVMRRMDGHLQPSDECPGILCPRHHIPMRLKRKREHNGTLLDMYHLRCPFCSQLVKLKSMAQIASFLQQIENRGILP